MHWVLVERVAGTREEEDLLRTNWIAIVAVAIVSVAANRAHAHELELGFGFPHGVEVGVGLGNERVMFTAGVGGSVGLFEDREGDPSFAGAAIWVPLGLKAYLTEPAPGRVVPTFRARLLAGLTGWSDQTFSERGRILGGLFTVGAAYLPTEAVSVGVEAGGYAEVVRWREDGSGPTWRDRYFGVVARVTLAIRFGVGADEAGPESGEALDDPGGAD